jgi:hypothetical protein
MQVVRGPSSPGPLGPLGLEFQWRSHRSGGTDFGRGVTCNILWSVEEQNDGADVYVRNPAGPITHYTLSGGVYSSGDCCAHQTLPLCQRGVRQLPIEV